MKMMNKRSTATSPYDSEPHVVMEKNDLQRIYQTSEPQFPTFDFELSRNRSSALVILYRGILPICYSKNMQCTVMFTLFPLLVED